MFIKNISGEAQAGVETGFFDQSLTVLPEQIIQVTESKGLFYIKAMKGIFETVTPTGTDPNNLGWFPDPATLNAAHPVGVAGNFAQVGSTDTTWIWSVDGASWVDTGGNAIKQQGITITSNGQTVFALAVPIQLPGSATILFVNGQRANYGTQYIFNTATEMQWLNVGYPLETTDNMVLYY